MNQQLPETTDVLIVGCGPVGATLANMLGRRGVRTLIVDKTTEIFQAPRAIAFDSDALRILQSIGVGEPEFHYTRIPHVRMVSPIFGEFVRANTSRDIDTHPMQVTFHQPQLETLLRAKAAELPGVVEMGLGFELVGFTENRSAVSAQLKMPDGAVRRVDAQFLVGADGAGSLVRQLIGQDFDGKSFVEDWLIVDAVNAREPIDHIEFLCDPARPTPHMPAPGGRQRWEFMLAKGEKRLQMESDSEIERLLSPWGGLAAMTIERRAVYRFHARCANSFRKGRVLLVGDAAHITPPFVGQGLVSGLRDAANLGWKLAMVVQGKAAEGLLDSYDMERRPHAKSMIRLARFIGKSIMPRSRVAAFVIHGAMRTARVVPGLRPLLDDLEIKPKNRFRKGFFLRGGRFGTLRPGEVLPQIWLTEFATAPVRSDEALGPGFALVGFGVDPCRRLSSRSRQALENLDVRFAVLPAAAAEGSTRAVAPAGTVAMVRPDRVVFGLSGEEDIERLVEAALRVFGSSDNP